MERQIKKYRKRGFTYAEPYIPAEHDALVARGKISVSEVDIPEIRSTCPGGMVATNPNNGEDRWYIAEDYFKANYAKVKNGQTA